MATGELVVEEVAENLEEAAAAVRTLDTKAVSFLLGGLVIGVGVGFYFGYRYNREKIRALAFEESREEIEQIRDYYARTQKPQLEDIVEKKGYDTTEPVQRPLPAPVPVSEPRPMTLVEPEPEDPVEKPNLETVRTEENSKDKNAGWSYPVELNRRSSTAPYIIHQDEFMTNESEFQQEVLTYYEIDGVLADQDDSILHNQVSLIGDGTLNRFGHGADDYNVLYVRNPHLEMEYEICRVQKSFEVDVQGLDNAPEQQTEPD